MKLSQFLRRVLGLSRKRRRRQTTDAIRILDDAGELPPGLHVAGDGVTEQPDPFPDGTTDVIAWCNDCGEVLAAITCRAWFASDLSPIVNAWRAELGHEHGEDTHGGATPMVHFGRVEEEMEVVEPDCQFATWGGVVYASPCHGSGQTLQPWRISASSTEEMHRFFFEMAPAPGFRTWAQLYGCAMASSSWSGMRWLGKVCDGGRCAAVEDGHQSSLCWELRSYETMHPVYGQATICYPPRWDERVR